MMWPFIVVFTIVGLLTAWILYKKATKIEPLDRRVFRIKDDRKRVLPSGLTLWVEKGANVTELEIEAIERGMLANFERARALNYDRPTNLSDYIVAIMGKSERAPESRIWAHRVPPAQYEGTEWDLGGYILAGGQMIAYGPITGNIIALPDHHGENIRLPNGETDLEEYARVADNEVQHVVLAHCNYHEFLRTRTHGIGQGHPLY